MASKVRGKERSRGTPLEQVDRILEESAGPLLARDDARSQATIRALAALDAAGADPRAAGVALLAYVSDVVVAHAVELAASPRELGLLLEQIDTVAGIPPAALARDVLGATQLLSLRTAVAIEVQLAFVLAFTGGTAVSLWTLSPRRQLKHMAHAGESDVDARRTRGLAHRLLAGEPPASTRGRDLAGVIVERWQQPDAVLIARGKDAGACSRTMVLEAAAPMLTSILERDQLLTRAHHSEEAMVAAAERRLTRLRFDLHDGPQQDVILLAEDVRLLRSQLDSVMDGQPLRELVLGRFDDLEARLVAIDGDLRRIAAFVESPFLQSEPIPEALARLTDEFAARSGIEPRLELKGDFTTLTDSQQITLLGLIREALSNIREHSDATHVTIVLASRARGISATVTDDGRGFDPETMLVKAAREGHLGLVGMHERVRLLGGRTEIDSRPGGPTVISAILPAFRPVAGGAS